MTGPTITAGELAGLHLFEGLSQDELAPVARVASRRRLSDGETLLEQGQPADAVYAIVSGQLVLRVADEGGSAIVATLGPGDLLGWSSLRERATALSTARAAGDTEVVAIPVDAVIDLVAGGSSDSRRLVQRLIAIAAADLAASRVQLLRSGREGVITGG